MYFRPQNLPLTPLGCLVLAVAAGILPVSRCSEIEAAEVVPAALRVAATDVIQLEIRRPTQLPGQVCAAKITLSDDHIIRAHVKIAELHGTGSTWSLLLEQSVSRRETELLLKLLEARGLENFDAIKVQEKCDGEDKLQNPSDKKGGAGESSPVEALSIRYPHCKVPAVIMWTDLAVQAKRHESIQELQALNQAVEEVVALALSVCPETAPLRDFLKRP